MPCLPNTAKQPTSSLLDLTPIKDLLIGKDKPMGTRNSSSEATLEIELRDSFRD